MTRRPIDRRVFGLVSAALVLGGLALAADCNENGVDDDTEGLPDCNGNGIPDDCDLASSRPEFPESVLTAGRQTFQSAFAIELDGDGKLDVVATTTDLTGVRTVVLRGRGDGSLTEHHRALIATLGFGRAGTPTAADFDGDADPDLAITIIGSEIAVVRNEGNGELALAQSLRPPDGGVPVAAHAASVDGEPGIDLIGIGMAAGRATIWIFSGDGEGEFSVLGTHPLPGTRNVVGSITGDFDEDGDVDVIVSTTGVARLVKNDGAGGFSEQANLALPGLNTGALRSADLDADGIEDLVATDSSGRAIAVAWGRGNGTFDATGDPVAIPESYVASFFVHDMNADGRLDIGGANPGRSCYLDGFVWTIENTGNRELGRVFEARTAGQSLFGGIGDFSGDGLPDVVGVNGETGEIRVDLHRRVPASSDCNANDVPDECELEFDDCDRNGVLDECEIEGDGDCNANGILDRCEPDCNGNGVPDDCDLVAGTDNDCNSDGVLDSCELAENDRNQNGIPDDCDLAADDLADCNGNGVDDAVDLARRFGMSSTSGFFTRTAATDLGFGDFDGDGDTDVLVASHGACCPSANGSLIFVENSRGMLVESGVVQHLDKASRVHVGELNGDGLLDAVVVSGDPECESENWGVHIVRGLGDGRFEASLSSPRERPIRDSELTDIDGDGTPEIVLSFDRSATAVEILFTNGNEVLESKSIPYEGDLWAFTIADFTGDDRPDLMLAMNPASEVQILPGTENGSFGPVVRVSVPENWLRDIAAGDLDDDGDVDLVVLGRSTNRHSATGIFILWNEDGRVAARRTEIIHESGAERLSLGDLNRDGLLDVITAGTWSHNPSSEDFVAAATISYNRGHRRFAPAAQYELGAGSVSAVRAIDLDGSGSSAMVAAVYDPDYWGAFDPSRFDPELPEDLLPHPGAVRVLRPVGREKLGGLVLRASPANGWQAIRSRDFDRDGIADFVLVADQPAEIHFFRGTGRSEFASPLSSPTGLALFVPQFDTGDVNADGQLDLAFATRSGLMVSHGRAGGRFDPAQPTGIDDASTAAVLGDLDADGDIDAVLTVAAALRIAINDGEGIFSAGRILRPGATPARVEIHDLDADGRNDIVSVNSQGAADNLSIFFGDAEGAFASVRSFAVGSGASSLAVGDVDGDGLLDAVTANFRSSNLAVIFNRGDRAMTPPMFLPAAYPYRVALADFDGDGDLDALSNGEFGLAIHLGLGDGSFLPTKRLADLDGQDLIITDFQNDGLPDAILPFWADTRVGIAFVENRTGSTSLDRNDDGIPDECQAPAEPRFLRGDANADGRTDLSDAVFGLVYLFARGDPPPCTKAADADDNGRLNIGDATWLLGYLFGGGVAEIPPPFNDCGSDPTEDRLDCAMFAPCGAR